MKPTANGEEKHYRVDVSGVVTKEIKQLFREAEARGVGEQALRIFRQIHSRLQQDPFSLGEPMYRLPHLRLQLRLIVIPPISVVFAVHEEQPLVFIKVVNLLSTPGE
jgi:hypothetical protein